ncbi:uncharacterized protein LOC136078620 [Hydra vulgaris]|uniref:Uncharacterized protein LOC136078611 n=1 Tax=Hydra vulgaris TaxID=6087 RepID=A0ABM4BN01_HYDVU
MAFLIINHYLSSATSLDILANEIKTTNVFLYEYRENGFSDAHIKAPEIAEVLGIEKVYPIVRSQKKKSISSYECVDHTRMKKSERFEQISIVTKLYDFLYRSENLIKAYSEDSEIELKRFVIVIKEEKNTLLKSAHDFLNYIYKEELQDVYPNLVIALRIFLTLPIAVASAGRSFSKSTMVDERLSSLAMLSIENEFARK